MPINPFVRVCLSAAVCAAAAAPAGAQPAQEAAGPAGQAPASIADLTLERLMTVEVDTVFGASRYAQRVTEAPASITIVTHDEIVRFGYRTFADLLRGVRGFYVTYDRNYSYVGIRGLSRPGDYNTRVLLLIDGHRLNDAIYDGVYLGTDFPLDLALIERVEVIRGPGSALYGTNAFFAVINVVTKKAAAAGRVRGEIEVGSLSARGGGVGLGHEYGPAGGGLVLGGSWFASDGVARLALPGAGTAVNLDGERVWRLFGSSTRGPWTLQGLYASRSKSIPTGAFGVSLLNPDSATEDDRGYLELRFDGALAQTAVSWRASYDRYDYQGRYAYGDRREQSRDQFDSATADWITTEVTLSRRVARRHFLTGGGELRIHLRQRQRAYYAPPFEADLDRTDRSEVGALFVQDEFTPAAAWTFSLGVRQDWYSSTTRSTNVRGAAILKPWRAAALKLLHGTAFRAPNAYELYYAENPMPLAPERIRTTELVWEQYLPHLRLTATGFHYRARDLVSQMAAPETALGFVFRNADAMRGAGLELEAEAAWRALLALASYSFVDVTRDGDAQPASNAPRHLWRARATAPLVPRRLFVGVETLYTGDRYTLGRSIAGGGLLGNLTLTSARVRQVELSLSVGNLFDRTYADPGAEEHPTDVIPQDGRTLRARLTWHF